MLEFKHSAWLVLIGAGAVSAIPTFAGKRLKLPVSTVLPVLALIGLLMAGLVTQPWITYLVITTLYLASIPLAVIRFYRARAGESKASADKDNGAAG